MEHSETKDILQGQKKLENGRNALRIALQAVKAYAWIFDYKSACITDSGTLGEAYGLPTVVENLPQSILDLGFVAPESVEDFCRLYADTASEKTVSADIRSTVPGEHGEEWFRIIYTPAFDDEENYVNYIGVAINITEQKHREQQYEEQLSLNRIAAREALSCVSFNLSKNLITSFSYTDPDFQMHKSYKTANELLRGVKEVVTEEAEQAKFEVVADAETMIRAFREGKKHIEFIFHMKESVTWQRVTYDMMENPYTGDIEAISAIYDATDAVRTEFVINKLTAMDYQSIGLIDLKTGILFPFTSNAKSRNMQKLMMLQEEIEDGYEGLKKFFRKYAVEGTAEQIILENSLPVIRQKLSQAPVYETIYALIQQGEKRHFRAIYSYLENADGAMLCAVQDITEICRQEEEQRERLALTLRKAEAANEAKTAFLSRVSHDMRTPINGILGLTALMKDAVEDAHMRKDLMQIELAGQYLLSLVNDTLDVNKIESGNLELHPTVCDGRIVLGSVQNLIMPALEAKKLRMEVNVDKLFFHHLYVDEGRLQQIAMNIIGNAVKFTPEGGLIRLEAETLSEENGIFTDRFVVEDNGCGMSSEFLPRLFDAFSQENATTTNSNQGTGLGMSITKCLVELMNGEISVKSEQGKGTRVELTLKLQAATEEQIAAWKQKAETHVASCQLKDRRILLCEDHPLNTKITKRLLEKKHILVDHAENGKVGAEMFAASPEGYYDAVLMDIRMPVMDGVDAARVIRAMQRSDAAGVPIIALTANALDHDVELTRQVGMNAHLSKPIDPEQLYAALERQIHPEE